MDFAFPPSPQNPPPGLSEPTASYKRHAWIALLSLLAFGTAYIAVTGYFIFTAYRLVQAVRMAPQVPPGLIFAGALSGFLALMMLRGLWPKKHVADPSLVRITAAQHPKLFAFIDRIAEEVGAPKPKAVFLSPRVNASMFYSVSLYNLVWPVKKQLEIGLGLLNVVTVGELRAILAHEFGHFAQASGNVGRFVYIAQRITGEFVSARGKLDRFLHFISSIDLRIAWIGWLARIVVWSVRSVFETLFGGLLVAERALSREMEFQADMVSVSVAGSDAILTALYKTRAADDCLDQAMSLLETQGAKKRRFRDIYALQTQIIDRMTAILADPHYLQPPGPPDSSAGAAQFQLFKPALAQPPKMWATHPPNTEREANAKKQWVACEPDTRSPWLLFDHADQVRQAVTRSIYKAPDELTLLTDREEAEALHEEFGDRFLDPQYRGMYLGIGTTRHSATTADLFADADAGAALDDNSLVATIGAIRSTAIEQAQLKALILGAAQAPGGVVRFRGVDRKSKELPSLLAEVEREKADLHQQFAKHAAATRGAYRKLAQARGPAWRAMHDGLVAQLHYLEHTLANVRDLWAVLSNEIDHAFADGNISGAERKRIVAHGNVLQAALAQIYDARHHVSLCSKALLALGGTSWAQTLGEFKLPAATPDNLGDWLQALPGWLAGVVEPAAAARRATLNHLLLVEAALAPNASPDQTSAFEPATATLTVPPHYETLLVGHERPIKERLSLWDRFFVGQGIVPATIRFAIAAALMLGLFFVGRSAHGAEVFVYNPIDATVDVSINGTHHDIPARRSRRFTVDGDRITVVTTLDGQQIEQVDEPLEEFSRYIYNIRGLALLEQQTVYYSGGEPSKQLLPRRVWQRSGVDYIFDEPPQSGKRGSSVELVEAIVAPPVYLASIGKAEANDTKLAADYAAVTPVDSPEWTWWMAQAMQADLAVGQQILAARKAELAKLPPARRAVASVLLARLEQEHSADCATWQNAAKAAPADGDAAYLALRCHDQGRDEEYQAAARGFPDNPWLQLAVARGRAAVGDWASAHQLYKRHLAGNALLRELFGAQALRVEQQVTDNPRLHHRSGLRIEPRLWGMQGFRSEEIERALATNTGNTGKYGATPAQLAAVSGNAKASRRSEFVRTPPADVYIAPILVYGAALRAGEQQETWQRAVQAQPNGDARVAFVKAVMAAWDARPNQTLLDPASIAKLLGTQAPEDRGAAYAAACTILGTHCPLDWRQQAQNLLFDFERPLF